MDEKAATTLRTPFQAEEVGKLPRVTCPKCSDRRNRAGTCEEHPRKEKCGECQAYVSPRHIHIDYVGHADVTARLLDADPDWAWEPKAVDADPAVLTAAVATGNPEIVQMVLNSAPPKMELDDDGNPVGFWIRLTVGGVTRPGYGSCPSSQGDAVKVLIGDALRNAAMRFGVALGLWAKGDRADPAAENATASAGKASRGRQQSAGDAWDSAAPAQPRGRRPDGGTQSAGDAWEQAAPAQQQHKPQPANVQDDVLGAWAAKLDEIATIEDGIAVSSELERQHKGGVIDSGRYKVIAGAIKARVDSLAGASPRPHRPAGPPAAERGAVAVPVGKGDDGEWVQGWMQRLGEASSDDDLASLQAQIGPAVKAKTISPAKSADLAKAVRQRRSELEPVPA